MLAAAPGLAAAQATPATPAAPAAAAAPAAPAAAAAAKAPEPLGRMFFTPPQRAQLDVARTQRARTTLATEKTEEVVTTAAPVAQSITYDGAVRRSDGKSTVWLNSRPVNDKEPAGAIVVGRVRADGGVTLQMPQSGRTVDLKPGQSIELLSGAIEESFLRKPATPPEAKPTVKVPPEARAEKSAASASAERDREDRERQLDDAARAQRDAAAAKAPAPTAGPAAPPR